MKKKISAAGVILLVLTVCLTALAANEGVREAVKETAERLFDVRETGKLEEEIVTVTKNEDRFDAIAEYLGYDTPEKSEMLRKTALFMERYCVSDEQFKLMETMILEGCDIPTLMDIYSFYLTTNEDVKIVRDIYDYVWDGEPIENGEALFEDAFNELTDYKCGVLTKEEIESYLEKGLTINDIAEANILSRKGVLKINEILDKIIAGEDWKDIGEAISGQKINADSDVAGLMQSAQIMNVTVNEAAQDGKEEAWAEEKAKTVNEILMKKGYWTEELSENSEYIIEKAKKRGISESEVKELLENGYDESDILNALQNDDVSAGSLEKAVIREESAK